MCEMDEPEFSIMRYFGKFQEDKIFSQMMTALVVFNENKTVTKTIHISFGDNLLFASVYFANFYSILYHSHRYTKLSG